MGRIRVYSGLAMRKLCTLFVLLSLAATAAAPPTPTVLVTCPGGTAGGCSQAEWSATNLDPSTTYLIEGFGPNSETFDFGPLTPLADGTFDSGATYDLLSSGMWTFELHAIGNNGSPHHHALATYIVAF
jgi:hypothetical protein